MNPKVGGSSPPQVEIFLSQKLRHFHKNIRSWVENDCCFSCKFSIWNINLTSKVKLKKLISNNMLDDESLQLPPGLSDIILRSSEVAHKTPCRSHCAWHKMFRKHLSHCDDPSTPIFMMKLLTQWGMHRMPWGYPNAGHVCRGLGRILLGSRLLLSHISTMIMEEAILHIRTGAL